MVPRWDFLAPSGDVGPPGLVAYFEPGVADAWTLQGSAKFGWYTSGAMNGNPLGGAKTPPLVAGVLNWLNGLNFFWEFTYLVFI